MKKRTWAICVSLIMGACCALTACKTLVPPEPPAHEHAFAEDWSWNEENHWHAPTCGDTEEKKDFSAHDFGEGNRCRVCGYEGILPKPTYQPGETVTDDGVRREIFTAIREQEIAAMFVAYDVNLTGFYNDEPFEYIKSGEDDYDLTSGAESVPVFVKLAKNTLVYAEGEIVKTESGYGMTVECSAVLDKMLNDLSTAVAGLRKGVLPVGLANSISDLLWQPSMQNMLETLLYGITAEELTILLAGVFPEDAVTILPEAAEGTSAFDYLWICLRSPELAKALAELYFEDAESSSGLDAMLAGGIASAPLEFVWNVLFQKSFVQSEVLAEIETLREGLAGSDQIGTIAVNLDENYALTDLRLDLVFDNFTAESEGGSFLLDGTVKADAAFPVRA